MGLAKQTRVGHLQTPINFKGFTDKSLCPVRCLKAYEEATAPLRKEGQDQLFLAVNKTHVPVVSSTIAQWLKAVLKAALIHQFFSAYSTRGASASAASMSGVTCQQLLVS